MTRVFGLLNNIAPGPAPSTVLSRCPLMSLVVLKIVPARNCKPSSQNGHAAPPKQSRDPEDNPSSVGPEFELKLRGLRAKTNLKVTISDIETITPMPASLSHPELRRRWPLGTERLGLSGRRLIERHDVLALGLGQC
jgi:hypothetical protein